MPDFVHAPVTGSAFRASGFCGVGGLLYGAEHLEWVSGHIILYRNSMGNYSGFCMDKPFVQASTLQPRPEYAWAKPGDKRLG